MQVVSCARSFAAKESTFSRNDSKFDPQPVSGVFVGHTPWDNRRAGPFVVWDRRETKKVRLGRHRENRESRVSVRNHGQLCVLCGTAEIIVVTGGDSQS